MQITPKTIFFIIYPTVSHYTSVLPLADKYKKEGHKVYIGGNPTSERLITEHGFRFVPLNYYETYEVSNVKNACLIFASCFFKKFVRRRFREFANFRNQLQHTVNELKPGKICLDAHLGYYYALLSDSHDFLVLNTKLSTYKTKGVPPLSCGQVYRNSFWYRFAAEVRWLIAYIRTSCFYRFRHFVFHCKDEKYFISRELYKINKTFYDVFLPLHASIFYLELNISRIKSASCIVANKRLEYDWRKLKPFEFYADLPYYSQLQPAEQWKELYLFLNKHAGRKKGRWLIYCAFGTITGRRYRKIEQFIKKLLVIALHNPQFTLIISTGNNNNPNIPAQENVFMGSVLPQQNILAYTDMMITHGGMNSIQECLQYKVPMLVYPLNTKFDQPGNAARVQYHGFGLKGNMELESSWDITRKINACLKIKF